MDEQDKVTELLMSLATSIIKDMEQTDVNWMRVYHRYHANSNTLTFDTAISPAGLTAIPIPPTPAQKAFIPSVTSQLTVDDAKQLRAILDEFITLAETANDLKDVTGA